MTTTPTDSQKYGMGISLVGIESIDELISALSKDKVEERILKSLFEQSAGAQLKREELDAVQRLYLSELEDSLGLKQGAIKTFDALIMALLLRHEREKSGKTDNNRYVDLSEKLHGPMNIYTEDTLSKFAQPGSETEQTKKALTTVISEHEQLITVEQVIEQLITEKGEDLQKLLNYLKERYKFEHPSHSYLALLFLKVNNAPLSVPVIKRALEMYFGLNKGTVRRIVSSEIGPQTTPKPRNENFIVAGTDLDTELLTYHMNPEVFEELKREVIEWVKNNSIFFKKKQLEAEIIGWKERAVEFLVTTYLDMLVLLLEKEPPRKLVIDWNDLYIYDKELAGYVRDDPDEGLKIFTDALMTILKEESLIRERTTVKPEPNPEDWKIVFKNVENPLRVKDLSARHSNKLVSVRAIISAVSMQRKYFYEKTVFTCAMCGHSIILVQNPLEKIVKPNKCPACHSTDIRLDKKESTKKDITHAQIQDIPEDLHGAEHPARVYAYVLGEHLEAYPGDRVIITGIVRDFSKGELTHTTNLVLEVLHIEVLEPRQITSLSEKDIKELLKLKERYGDELPKAVARSIAPEIIEMDDVKLSVALAVASKKDFDKKRKMRLWSHILLFGDRGTGKSQILKDIKDIVNGVLVTGGEISKVGLTATVERDEFAKEWVVRGGAIVRANKGVLIIDEADKVPRNEFGALHSPMSFGILGVSKASVTVELKAYTSVLMAANPLLGYVNDHLELLDQLPFPVTLFERFDLVWVLRLRDDDEFLRKVTEIKKKVTLEGIKREIDKNTLRKLFQYTQLIEVQWTEEALDEVNEFFIKVTKAIKHKRMAYSPRLWGAIYRLSEAHARLRLSDKVELKDVKEVERLIIESIKTWGSQADDETGDVDWSILIEVEKRMTKEEEKVLTELIRLFKELHEEWGERIPENIVLEFLNARKSWDVNIAKKYLTKAQEKGILDVENGYWFLANRA